MAEQLANLSPEQRSEILDSLSSTDRASLYYDWRGFMARQDQIAPDGDWDIWMILAGRGWGKTRTGAEFVREEIISGRAKRIALVAETQRDLEKVMIEGDSGLLAIMPPDLRFNYRKKPVELRFENGATALGYNATEPDQLRGPQHDLAWSDEVAKWRYARETWDQLQFGLRLGNHPRQIVTTTPKPIELVKSLLLGREGKVHVTNGHTRDNFSNLAPRFIEKIYGRYQGTRLGRQELDGEVLGDLPGALWRQDDIDLWRQRNAPVDLDRVVVAIDPAVSNTEDSDHHGIIVAGLKGDQAYIIEDGSCLGTPLDWARQAIGLYDQFGADELVAERNNGGDMVKTTLQSVRPSINVKLVWASRGKVVRAEPVSALYQQGRVHHIGCFSELEQQMTQMTTSGYSGDGSPDRVDALVWAITELFPDLNREPQQDDDSFAAHFVSGWMAA